MYKVLKKSHIINCLLSEGSLVSKTTNICLIFYCFRIDRLHDLSCCLLPVLKITRHEFARRDFKRESLCQQEVAPADKLECRGLRGNLWELTWSSWQSTAACWWWRPCCQAGGQAAAACKQVCYLAPSRLETQACAPHWFVYQHTHHFTSPKEPFCSRGGFTERCQHRRNSCLPECLHLVPAMWACAVDTSEGSVLPSARRLD